MRKWVFLLLALVLAINFVTVGIGCKAKAPEKPKEEAKPAEAKPAEAPPPAAPAPAEKPAETPAEAPKK